jgi:hypothetical protein
LVNLVEDWESIERYTQHLSHWAKIGSYQLKKSSEGAEIKVCVGKFGYIKKFKEPEDPELIKILAFCQAEGFIKVQGSVSDELFYA